MVYASSVLYVFLNLCVLCNNNADLCIYILSLSRYMFIQTFTTLNLVSRDSLSAVNSQAGRIIMEKTPHLQDHSRVQVKERRKEGGREEGRGDGGREGGMIEGRKEWNDWREGGWVGGREEG